MARGRTVGKTGHRFASYLRRCGLAAAALLCCASFAAPGSADDDPVKATLAATVNDGYARLVFDMSEYDDASVRLANNVLVITFKRPIDVSIDRLASQIPDYVGTARRDPDGKGIRVALAQQVKVIATPAAEKYFIDLLPASWSGQPPNLPPEVIADLARRAGAGGSSRAQRAPGRCAAAGDGRAGARACVDAADLHPLRLRHTGQYLGVHRSRQGAADADFRRADQIRPCRCRGGAAARDRRHRCRIARRQRAGALQLPGQGRRPHLPRRWQLRARYRRRRQQAGRGERGARRAGCSAAKCGARNHRAGNSPARGGERSCPAQR